MLSEFMVSEKTWNLFRLTQRPDGVVGVPVIIEFNKTKAIFDVDP